MFGPAAPLWPFLECLGGPANPFEPLASVSVIETYPVLTMVALGWVLPDARAAGRLPKYNPKRKKTFSISDWRHVCARASTEFRSRGLSDLAHWLDQSMNMTSPSKSDQDCLDACICLLAGFHVMEGLPCLVIGDLPSGYIVVPHEAKLAVELAIRTEGTARAPADWVRTVRLAAPGRELI